MLDEEKLGYVERPLAVCGRCEGMSETDGEDVHEWEAAKGAWESGLSLRT